MKDRRTALAERINNTRNIVTIYPEDLVMARITIQSYKAYDKVAKLSYAVRVCFNLFETQDMEAT